MRERHSLTNLRIMMRQSTDGKIINQATTGLVWWMGGVVAHGLGPRGAWARKEAQRERERERSLIFVLLRPNAVLDGGDRLKRGATMERRTPILVDVCVCVYISVLRSCVIYKRRRTISMGLGKIGSTFFLLLCAWMMPYLTRSHEGAREPPFGTFKSTSRKERDNKIKVRPTTCRGIETAALSLVILHCLWGILA